MIKFINKFTGSEMWVADKRKDEYVAAGHKLAATVISKSAEPEKEPEKEKTVRKRMKK